KRAGKKPAVLPIVSTERKCILPRLAAFKVAQEFFLHPLEMVWMMDCLPTPALHLFQGGAGIVEPALIIPKNPTIRVRHPGQLRNIFSERPKAGFAFLQGFLRPLLFGDVVEKN